MATLCETLAVSCASGFPSATFSPIVCSSSVSAIPRRWTSLKLPESRGLKISYAPSTGSVSSISRVLLCKRRIVSESRNTSVVVPIVTDAEWQSVVLESDMPVLVEFWAPWCGPCRMIHPIIDELAREYTGKLKCYKLNTDESPNVPTKYGIRSIPTVIIFKFGEKKDAVIGAVPKSTLTSCIEKFL